MKRVLLTTGGTGGHIFPALAVAEALRERHPGIELLFVGSQYGPEARLACAAGVPFAGLPVRGFLGRGLRAAGAACRMLYALGKALRIARRFRPDVVAGFGGYAAFAPMVAGRVLGVPCVLHEQNAIAGASNRILGRIARRICLSLPDTEGFDASRCVVTGNPVRAAVARLGQRTERAGTRHLLVLGGSQGAHALNVFLLEHLEMFRAAGVEIRHQTGKADLEAARAGYAAAGYGAGCAAAFIDDMAEAYAWADLVLCRAGASTVAELCAAGLPSVLVPFPHAIHDHQTRNARVLERCGAAVLVPETGMRAGALAQRVARLLGDAEALRRMAGAARAVARPHAAAEVARVLEDVAAGASGRVAEG